MLEPINSSREKQITVIEDCCTDIILHAFGEYPLPYHYSGRYCAICLEAMYSQLTYLIDRRTAFFGALVEIASQSINSSHITVSNIYTPEPRLYAVGDVVREDLRLVG